MGDKTSTSEANRWRRRERSLLGGLIIWAVSVGWAATYAPDMVAGWITNTHAFAVAGFISISIGLCAGFVEFVWITISQWKEPSNSELTNLPWEDGNG